MHRLTQKYVIHCCLYINKAWTKFDKIFFFSFALIFLFTKSFFHAMLLSLFAKISGIHSLQASKKLQLLQQKHPQCLCLKAVQELKMNVL